MHFSKVQTLKPLLCTLKGSNQSIPALDEDDKAGPAAAVVVVVVVVVVVDVATKSASLRDLKVERRIF